MTPSPVPPTPLTVRVPGSTSNLGSGFDALGLAVDRYLTATWSPGPQPLRIRYAGFLAELGGVSAAGSDAEGSQRRSEEDLASADRSSGRAMGGPDPRDDSAYDLPRALNDEPAADLAARALQVALERRGLGSPGGALHLTSEIPLGRGLGSSGAAVVAGLALAAARAGETLDRDGALAEAVAIEGHPDNAAPALHGGLVAAAQDPSGGHVSFQLPLCADLGFAYAAPERRLATAEGRRVLPATVAHAQAVAGLGRALALAQGLATGRPDLLRAGFADDLHVPFRLPLIPGGRAAMEAGLEAGAWAVTVSGSGSGLFAVAPPSVAEAVADAMTTVFLKESPGAVGFPLHPDFSGVVYQ